MSIHVSCTSCISVEIILAIISTTESKEGEVKSEDLGKDIASVQALLSKHVCIYYVVNHTQKLSIVLLLFFSPITGDF